MKKIEEIKEFDTIEENLKDYKKKRRKTMWVLLNVVGLFFSIWQTASYFPRHVEQFFPGLVYGVRLNDGYDALNLGVPAEGTLLINGVEVDLAQLKEETGILYYVIVPMTRREARQQLRNVRNFERGQNWSLAPMFGYTLDLSYDEHLEYGELYQSYIQMIKDDQLPIKTEFTNLVKEIISCRYKTSYSENDCVFGGRLYKSPIQYQYLPSEIIDRYDYEFELKGEIFRFMVYKEYVQSKGYNLEDYLPDPVVLRLSFD